MNNPPEKIKKVIFPDSPIPTNNRWNTLADKDNQENQSNVINDKNESPAVPKNYHHSQLVKQYQQITVSSIDEDNQSISQIQDTFLDNNRSQANQHHV